MEFSMRENPALKASDTTQYISGAADSTQFSSSSANPTQFASSAADPTQFASSAADPTQFVSSASDPTHLIPNTPTDPTQIIPSDPPAYHTIAHSYNNSGFYPSTEHLVAPHLRGPQAANSACHDHQPPPYTPSSSYCALPKSPQQPRCQVERPVWLEEASQWPVVVVGVQDENAGVLAETDTPGQQSYVGHIVFSCVVLLLFGIVFGLIAFILAYKAQKRSAEGQASKARCLGACSLFLSIAGILIGVFLIAALSISLSAAMQ